MPSDHDLAAFKNVDTTLVNKGPKGDKGDPGIPGGGGSAEQFVAGENISSPRAVMVSAGVLRHFDPTNESSYFKLVGVSATAGLTGTAINVVPEGLLESPGSFVQDAVYWSGANGVLTTSVPTSGIAVKIGVAESADVLVVDISQPMVLI